MNHILDRIELLLSAAEIGEKRDCSTPLSTPQHPPMPSMYILYIHCKDLHIIYIIHTFIYINIYVYIKNMINYLDKTLSVRL